PGRTAVQAERTEPDIGQTGVTRDIDILEAAADDVSAAPNQIVRSEAVSQHVVRDVEGHPSAVAGDDRVVREEGHGVPGPAAICAAVAEVGDVLHDRAVDEGRLRGRVAVALVEETAA